MPRPASVLSDGTITRLVEEGHIRIDPWLPDMVQPASVDLRLGPSFRVFHNHRAAAIDLDDPPANLTEQVTITDDDPFVIHPGEFVLGRTLEYVELPTDVVARIEGKALALDTEVPTPNGMRDMSDLEGGDLMFGGDGRPTPVVATSEIMRDRDCREVVFSDGTRVVADADHQWEAWSRGVPTVVTTRRLAQTLHERWHVAPVPLGEQLRAYHDLNCSRIGANGTTALLDRPRPPAPHVVPERVIVAVNRVPSEPVRCIQVADPRGVFLITRSFIPTHNSSLGRLGLIVHATAGFVDPGFKGTLTLEITNLTRVPIKLYAGRPIAQLSFMALDAPALRPYGSPELGSHYQGQVDATESRYGAPPTGMEGP